MNLIGLIEIIGSPSNRHPFQNHLVSSESLFDLKSNGNFWQTNFGSFSKKLFPKKLFPKKSFPKNSSLIPLKPLPDGNGRNEMRRVCPGRDVVLLMLSLVLSDYETRSTRVGEECDDGRAHGHDEIPDECFHVLAHKHFAPF